MKQEGNAATYQARLIRTALHRHRGQVLMNQTAPPPSKGRMRGFRRIDPPSPARGLVHRTAPHRQRVQEPVHRTIPHPSQARVWGFRRTDPPWLAQGPTIQS
jgi:hypothetical protein